MKASFFVSLPYNPLRVAEEYALIDTLSGGHLVAGLLRGAPYEYLVYWSPAGVSGRHRRGCIRRGSASRGSEVPG
jgi:alkanesulfonate monooxygenase SsuD/methylene tetrahydromethanopterin reductase-like flavin-dependent oxidoreductase (luciferase family)